jgi:hypothetical protein
LSINPGTGIIDLSISTPDTYTVTYTTDGTCPNSSNVSVTINALDNASFSYSAAAYCINDSDPTPTITGLPGGNFTSSPAGLSINAGTGIIDVSTSTPNTYTITYTTAGTCSNSSNVSVTINALDNASFNYSAAAYCNNDSDPTPTITGLPGGNFTSSPAGLSINAGTGIIDVSISIPDTYTVTYTTDGACPNSSNVSVTINASDNASFSYGAADYCINDSDPTPTVTGLTGGTFSSGAGLAINASTGIIDVSASTPGTYTVTYTTAGSCPNNSHVSVTINALDNASFSYGQSTYYQEGTDPTPTITGFGSGIFSSTPAGLSINTSTGSIDVSASTSDTYTVTFTTTGTCPNSSSVSVVVDDFSGVTFTYNTANGYTPQDPNGFNLVNNDLVVQDGTAVISSATTFNTVTVQPNAILDLDANITLSNEMLFESDATGSALLNYATGNSITGDVTVERYIPAKRAFRILASPVTTTGTIFDNWQQSGLNPGDSGYVSNLGTHITGSTSSANGHDATNSGNSSMFTFNNAWTSTQGGATNSAWNPITSTNQAGDILNAETPYLLLVRGDRSIDLTDNNATPTVTTLSATGEIFTGTSSPTLSNELEYYSLVANPYQAVLDFSATDRTDLTNFIYIWDPNIGSNGGYVSVELPGGAGTVLPPNSGTTNANQFIPPGLSLFVQNVSTGPISPSLTIEPSDINTSGGQVAVFNETSMFYINSRLYLTSSLQNGSTEQDALALHFNDSFTTMADDEDASKLVNPDENFAVINNGLRYIDKQTIPNIGHSIDLSVTNYTAIQYSMTFDIKNKPNGLGAFINDTYLGTQTELTDGFVYDFTVDASIPESIAEDRFSLVFDNTTLGIAENTFGYNFSLYPNPAQNGRFYITTPGLSGKAEVTLTNVLGQQVYAQQLDILNQEVQVHADKLSSGVYMLNLSQGDQSFSSKVIIE